MIPPKEVSEIVWLPLSCVLYAIDHDFENNSELKEGLNSLVVPKQIPTDCELCSEESVCGQHLLDGQLKWLDLTGDEHLNGLNEGIVIGTKKLLKQWASTHNSTKIK